MLCFLTQHYTCSDLALYLQPGQRHGRHGIFAGAVALKACGAQALERQASSRRALGQGLKGAQCIAAGAEPAAIVPDMGCNLTHGGGGRPHS